MVIHYNSAKRTSSISLPKVLFGKESPKKLRHQKRVSSQTSSYVPARSVTFGGERKEEDLQEADRAEGPSFRPGPGVGEKEACTGRLDNWPEDSRVVLKKKKNSVEWRDGEDERRRQGEFNLQRRAPRQKGGNRKLHGWVVVLKKAGGGESWWLAETAARGGKP